MGHPMDFVSQLPTWSGWVITVGGAFVVLLGFVKWVVPLVRTVLTDLRAIRDVLVGRDPVRDTITKQEIQPALPGIGQRIETQERQMAVLTDAVAKIADSHTRLEDIDGRVKILEAAYVERVVTRQDSAKAWEAIDAAIRATPDTEATED